METRRLASPHQGPRTADSALHGPPYRWICRGRSWLGLGARQPWGKVFKNSEKAHEMQKGVCTGMCMGVAQQPQRSPLHAGNPDYTDDTLMWPGDTRTHHFLFALASSLFCKFSERERAHSRTLDSYTRGRFRMFCLAEGNSSSKAIQLQLGLLDRWRGKSLGPSCLLPSWCPC